MPHTHQFHDPPGGRCKNCNITPDCLVKRWREGDHSRDECTRLLLKEERMK